jgi:hypothetical protein
VNTGEQVGQFHGRGGAGADETAFKSAIPLTEKHLARIYSGSMAATEAAFLVSSDASLHRVG